MYTLFFLPNSGQKDSRAEFLGGFWSLGDLKLVNCVSCGVARFLGENPRPPSPLARQAPLSSAVEQCLALPALLLVRAARQLDGGRAS